MKPIVSDSERFDTAVRKVLSVSREELRRREEEWKRLHAGRKAGRKSSKTFVSRVSGGKD